jgi:hypothetical protein
MHHWLIVLFSIVLACWSVSGWAAAQAATACAVLSAQEAVTLVGGPLDEVFHREDKPTMQNGYDHDTVCGYFPKGYNIQKADRPPERGLQVQLHTMRNNDDAKTFYERIADMSMQPSGPFTDAKLTPLQGVGEAAFLRASQLEPEPGAVYQVASVTFLKGKVMGQLTVWKKAAPVDHIANSAVQQVIAKLP